MTRKLYDAFTGLALAVVLAVLVMLTMAGCTTVQLKTTDCQAEFIRPVFADYVPGVLGDDVNTTNCSFQIEG